MNPPNQQTQMTAPDKSKQKMVKIQAVYPIRLGDHWDEKVKGVVPGKEIKPGEIVEVTEEEAQQFCDHKASAYYAFRGDREMSDPDFKEPKQSRAKRV